MFVGGGVRCTKAQSIGFLSDMSVMDVYYDDNDKRIILTSALRCRIGVLLITICVRPSYQYEVLCVCLEECQYLRN